MEDKKEILIVGGGMAGLSCAVSLSSFSNVRITIIEARKVVYSLHCALHLTLHAEIGRSNKHTHDHSTQMQSNGTNFLVF